MVVVVLVLVIVVIVVVVITIGVRAMARVLVWMDIDAQDLVIRLARRLALQDVRVMPTATTACTVPTTITLGLVPLAARDVSMTATIVTIRICVGDLVAVAIWTAIHVRIFHRGVPSVVVLVLNRVLIIGLLVLPNIVPIQTGLKGGLVIPLTRLDAFLILSLMLLAFLMTSLQVLLVILVSLLIALLN